MDAQHGPSGRTQDRVAAPRRLAPPQKRPVQVEDEPLGTRLTLHPDRAFRKRVHQPWSSRPVIEQVVERSADETRNSCDFWRYVAAFCHRYLAQRPGVPGLLRGTSASRIPWVSRRLIYRLSAGYGRRLIASIRGILRCNSRAGKRSSGSQLARRQTHPSCVRVVRSNDVTMCWHEAKRVSRDVFAGEWKTKLTGHQIRHFYGDVVNFEQRAEDGPAQI